ncbi:transcriptional adapter 2B [Anoplophora glabripennis]|uniref:transcriptional adapter 2B n=1 Tax=Anoplophora glabripennis TaxID=217634 RepID=UPI000875723F|nr:transcriptional adapter 2B [Anoplophora glabripennis]
MADLFAKVSCTYCQEEINGVRVQCCVCPDFDICLQCFSVGAEIGTHRNDHSYKFVDHCAVSIFGGRGAWTGKEQLQLLDAVELYGFGNWELVSQHVETRTPEEVKEEYIARYLDGNIGKATWAQLTNHRPVLVDHVPNDDGPLSPSVTSRLPPLEASLEEARLLGYKPHRDDYEREYNMEAEQLVSTLQLDQEEDTEMEVALKLAMVDMYTRRLRERARRKRIVRDYQLVAKYFGNLRKDPSKRPFSKEQRELRDKTRVFSQFLSSGEHERLLASIERERELRHRLSELLRYRSLGLTTQDEIIHYEQHAAYERQQQLKQSRSGSSGYAMQEFPTKNGRSDETDQSFTERRSMLLLDEEPESNSYFSSNSSSSDNVIQPVALNKLPLGNLLSENEIQLCTRLNIQPVHYVTLKSLIIQENLANTDKHQGSSSNSTSQDSTIREAVTQYLSYSGWLPGVSVV